MSYYKVEYKSVNGNSSWLNMKSLWPCLFSYRGRSVTNLRMVIPRRNVIYIQKGREQ